MTTRTSLKKINFLNDESQSEIVKTWLIETIEAHPILKTAFLENRAGILLADISNGRGPSWASINGDHEIYGASVPKLGILLGILYNSLYASDAKKNILSDFRDEISKMIKLSDNLESGKLYALTSHESIKNALFKMGLYDWNDSNNSGRGGLWCGGTYNIQETKDWFLKNKAIAAKYPLDFYEQKSKKSGELFALTARAGGTFLMLMESGQLFNENYSKIAKDFLEKISTSKFIKGIIRDDTQVNWFGKTGTFNGNLSEVTLIEGSDYSYILSFLISGHRDNEVFDYLGKATNNFIRTQLGS